MAKKKEADALQKLRLRVRAYDHKLIDNSVRQIIETAEKNDATVIGPIPLPTEMKKVHGEPAPPSSTRTSREQFELQVHKRLLDILNPTQKRSSSPSAT